MNRALDIVFWSEVVFWCEVIMYLILAVLISIRLWPPHRFITIPSSFSDLIVIMMCLGVAIICDCIFLRRKRAGREAGSRTVKRQGLAWILFAIFFLANLAIAVYVLR
jgi:hypothetical protein